MSTDAQAAIQRLREQLVAANAAGMPCMITATDGVQAALDALDAAEPLLAAADAYAAAWAVSAHIGGSLTAWALRDDLLQIAAARVTAQQPPAASRAAAQRTEDA